MTISVQSPPLRARERRKLIVRAALFSWAKVLTCDEDAALGANVVLEVDTALVYVALAVGVVSSIHVSVGTGGSVRTTVTVVLITDRRPYCSFAVKYAVCTAIFQQF